MLLLSRRRGESVVIGDNVEVTVMRVEGNQVQLGVTAPRNVPVHRREIYLAIKAENQGASQLNLQDLPVLPNKQK